MAERSEYGRTTYHRFLAVYGRRHPRINDATLCVAADKIIIVRKSDKIRGI